jgi:hypothetical protein
MNDLLHPLLACINALAVAASGAAANRPEAHIGVRLWNLSWPAVSHTDTPMCTPSTLSRLKRWSVPVMQQQQQRRQQQKCMLM